MSYEPSATSSPAPDVSAAPSLGASLRSLREARGLTPEDVSSRIKFSATQIRALEDERWEALPSGVSLRGLVRNYARLLDTDETALVEAVGGVVERPRERVSPMTPHTPTPYSPAAEREGIAWGWVVALLVFLAAGLLYAYWQGWLPEGWLSSAAP